MNLPPPFPAFQRLGRRLFGLETEYGFALPGGRPEQRSVALEQLMALARHTLRHLPGVHGTGLFTASGARLYVDCGSHPEFCTPEVDDPADLVRYVEAGDRILERLARDTSRRHGLPPIWIFKCHVDYRELSTWGCHENYACRSVADVLARQLLPHLASRILYTGAGGLNPFAPGIEFVLSPRVPHLADETHASRASRGGMYYLKEESLAGPGWHRLHVICGESVLSQRAQYLRVATTALVVALVEAGLQPGEDVSLVAPLQALQTFNADPRLHATARLANGAERTALDIQRHYLEFAEAHLSHPALPAWAAEACQLWRATLDQIQAGPRAVSQSLDWAIKRALYRARLQQQGFTRGRLEGLNSVLRQAIGPHGRRAGAFSPEALAALRPHLERILREQGLHWDDLCALLALRTQLCELEMHFSRLGPEGLFHTLDRQGLLDHRLPGLTPEQIDDAMHSPPPRGRARVRGRLIASLAGNRRHGADWDSVWDFHGRRIDLSDPFIETAPDWTPTSVVGPEWMETEEDSRPTVLDEVNQAYERGEYERALTTIQSARRWLRAAPPAERARSHQLESWVQARRGHTEPSLQASELAARAGLGELDGIADALCAYRFAGLAPRADRMEEWVRRGQAILDRARRADSPEHYAFLGHQGAMLMAAGRLADAVDVLERACAMARRIQPHSRVLARNLCGLAEVQRLLGHRAEAARCLHEARALQVQGRFDGDYAEFNLTGRARLLAHARGAAKQCLHEARLIQRRLGHRFGLARTMFLQARLFPNVWHNQRRKRLLLACQREIPALRDCPVAARILNHWDQWVGGHCEPGEDLFWGV